MLVLVTYLACAKGTFIFMAFYFPLAPVFLNSLLITLNAREFMLSTARGENSGPLAKWSNGPSFASPGAGGGAEEYRLGNLGRAGTFISQTKSAGGESFLAVTVERTTYEIVEAPAVSPRPPAYLRLSPGC
jgi:hypothetical protein